MTAGSPSPLWGTRSGKTGGRGAGTTKKLKAALGCMCGGGLITVPPPRLIRGDPLWGYIWVGGAGSIEMRTRALYQLLVTLIPSFQISKHLGLPVPISFRLDHPRRLPQFQAQTKFLLSSSLQSCSRPGWDWEAGCQGKYEAPTSRRLPALPRSAHTLHSPGWWQKRERRGGKRNTFLWEGGMEEMDRSAKFRGGDEQPATDPKGAAELRTCQSRQPGAREMYKVKLTSSALAGGAEK